MRVVDCGEQGSGEWLRARCGRITASRIGDLLNFTKKGESQKRIDYRTELVSERLSGKAVDKFVSFAMREGTRLEPDARTEYELTADVLLDRVGFVLHPEWNFSGASPDGLVGSDGGVEVKCPQATTHIEYLMAGVVPVEYEPQMVWNMVCCERQWWDFVSYCPDFPAPLNILVVRLERDEKRIAEVSAAVEQFHESVEETIMRVRSKGSLIPRLEKMVK